VHGAGSGETGTGLESTLRPAKRAAERVCGSAKMENELEVRVLNESTDEAELLGAVLRHRCSTTSSRRRSTRRSKTEASPWPAPPAGSSGATRPSSRSGRRSLSSTCSRRLTSIPPRAETGDLKIVFKGAFGHNSKLNADDLSVPTSSGTATLEGSSAGGRSTPRPWPPAGRLRASRRSTALPGLVLIDKTVLHEATQVVQPRIRERSNEMGFEQYHEPAGELSAETRTFARMIASLTEEAEAIGWYEQRIALEPDAQARAIMANAQLEEFKHFGMDLEFLLRRTPNWRTALQTILFTDGDIVQSGEAAEDKLDSD
jgi:hypothetical protein